MAIDRSRSIGDVGPVARKSTTGETGASEKNSPRAGSDMTTIMGVPEAELTPKVREATLQLMAEVDKLRRELKVSRERMSQLEKLADQDPLVPVANRRAFVRELARVMSYSQRYGTRSSVLYIDLDGLKAINDTYGHAAGDAALLHVAKLLMENVRGSDVVGRLGGDEFGVILAQADQPTANEKAAALASAIETRPLTWNGKVVVLCIAYGAYSFKPDEDPVTAIGHADKAMYASKQRPR
ncbi:MAG: GGDEF domain-containing protein [Alphaproteobacteria bacterium]